MINTPESAWTSSSSVGARSAGIGGGSDVKHEEVVSIFSVDTEVFFLTEDRIEVSVVDRVLIAAVEGDPFADEVEEGGFVFGEGSGFGGAEVHEEVCAGGSGSAEVFDDGGGRDHVEVIGGGSPVVVACHAHFTGIDF